LGELEHLAGKTSVLVRFLFALRSNLCTLTDITLAPIVNRSSKRI
jgi:hypothetical protein